jgi:PAS domain S-box-containing protein
MNLFNTSTDSIFKSLLQAAPDGILVCDSRGTITTASDQCEALFGYALTELIGQTIEVLVPDALKAKHIGLRERYQEMPRRRPMGVGLDLYARRKDGSQLPVEISLSGCMVDGEACVIAVVRDVSERRRLESDLNRLIEELKRSNEELEQFAYIASHDLQEPLRMVSGYTQLLKRRYVAQLDAEANEYIDYAVDGVKRMQALIQDLLAYARLSTRGRGFQVTDLNFLLRQVSANLATQVEEAGATITVGELPNLRVDASQVVQVFQNLVSNALKFRRPAIPLVIAISANRDGDYWRFTVSDNGIGIDPQYSGRIFEVFQRLHTRDQYPGNGIGLAICKKVVERHQGRIWFESTLGEGTSFHFTLPINLGEI